MKLQSLMLRNSLFLLTLILALPAFWAAAQTKPDSASAQEKHSKRQQGFRPLPRNDAGLEAAQEGPEFLRHRQDWLFKPRAFPLGFIPQGARERALQRKAQMYQREGRLSLFSVPGGPGFVVPPLGPTSAWFSIGPQPTSSSFFPPFTSGRVTALAVNPNNSNNVYVGGADGGLWVSADGGTAWTPLTDNPPNTGIPSVAVGAIAVDPTTCGSGSAGICTTVYVATGEDNFGGENIYGEGVLNCTITAGAPPTTSCTQDTTFHAPSSLDQSRGGPMIGALAVNRSAGRNNILLAGVRGRGSAIASGVWCSADKGSTWTRVLPTALTNGAGDPGTDVAFASDGTAWVALGFIVPSTGNGIYKSSAPVTSCAITWNQQTLPTAFTTSNIGRITLALAPSSDATIYAAIADATSISSNLLGVVRSTNANAATPTWTQLTDPLVSAAQGFCTGQCFYDMALAVDTNNPAVVYAGGSGQNPIIRTTNGTTTASWADVTAAGGASPHVDTHAFGFAGDGSRLYVGNDGGVWGTGTPAGTISWVNLNGQAGTSTGALNLTQFYPGVSIHPSNPGFALGGSQDNGIQVDQAASVPLPSASLLWQDSGLGCDGGFTVIDPSVPSTSYGECEYLPSTILIIGVTTAGDGLIGNGFLATSGIDGTDRGSFIPPLVVDKSNSQTLYFGTCRVWQTKDGANSWVAISPDVTSATHPAGCPGGGANLSTIAPAPSNSNTIYTGSDLGEIEVTSDGGATWKSITTSTLPTRSITRIAVDPNNNNIAYVVFSGFGSCAVGCTGPTGHVFKTVNGTAGSATVWTDIDAAGLPDIPVNAIVIDPDDLTHNTLYVGTDIGAFFTTNGGVSWSVLGSANSLPPSEILDLTLHNPSRTLRAATHGRGMWDINLGAGPNTPALEISKLSPFSANAPGAPTTLTVNGTGFTGSSAVMWNGSSRTTTFVSAAQLTAAISAADLGAGAVAQVNVKDGANTSNSLPFTVIGHAPTITNSTPASARVNSAATTITVTGTNFGSTSEVILNPDTGGTTITTSFVSATQLTATVPASFMAGFGSTNSVGVQNPPPGGGTTVTTSTVTLPTFTVVAPAPTNDNFASAMTVTLNAGTFTDTKDSSGATTQTSDPVPPCAQNVQIPFVTGVSNTIWYKFTPTASGTITDVDTIGSSYDSVLSIWTGSAGSLTKFACNDDINPGIVTESQLTNLGVNAGTTYYIMVSSFGPADPNPVALGGKTVFNFQFTSVTSSGSFTVSGAAATVTAGASGNSMITVTPTGGFAGNVAITCGTTLPGVSCTALNVTVPSGGGNGTGQLAINVTAPSAQNAMASVTPAERRLYAAGMIPASGGQSWWTLSGITGLAAIILLLLPGRKRFHAALGLGLVCVLSFMLGCSGYSGGGGGGPVATTTHITVTSATKAAAGATFTFTATVTGGTPTDQVQLLDGGSPTGIPVTVSGGTATLTTSALTTVGTHMITAHYAGDATYTQGSSSGALDVTVTGTTQLPITGTSGSATASGSVSLTIN